MTITQVSRYYLLLLYTPHYLNRNRSIDLEITTSIINLTVIFTIQNSSGKYNLGILCSNN